jgi:hypothetical protein
MGMLEDGAAVACFFPVGFCRHCLPQLIEGPFDILGGCLVTKSEQFIERLSFRHAIGSVPVFRLGVMGLRGGMVVQYRVRIMLR